jgi:hypothetical protein
MMNLEGGLSFAEYMNKSNEDQKNIQIAAYDNTFLSEGCKEDILNIAKPVNVVVFSRADCPDCTVTIPFIQKMQEINSNIKTKIYPLKGNEKLLEEYVGVARIPTVITFNEDWSPKGAYVEIPKAITAKITGKPVEYQKKTIGEYRAGKFNELVEAELLILMK